MSRSTACVLLLDASVTINNVKKSRLVWAVKHHLQIFAAYFSHYIECKNITPNVSRSTACAFLFGCLSKYYKCEKIAPGMSRKTPPANICCTPQSLLLMLTNHAWCEQKSTACSFCLDASVTIINVKKSRLVWAEKHHLQILAAYFRHYIECKNITHNVSRSTACAFLFGCLSQYYNVKKSCLVWTVKHHLQTFAVRLSHSY